MEHHGVSSLNLFHEFAKHELPIIVVRTILSSAGNDGRVRLWKQTIGGIWRAAGQLSVEQAEADSQDNDVPMEENVAAG